MIEYFKAAQRIVVEVLVSVAGGLFLYGFSLVVPQQPPLPECPVQDTMDIDLCPILKQISMHPDGVLLAMVVMFGFLVACVLVERLAKLGEEAVAV